MTPDYGTCDNCGAQGAKVVEWTVTRPNNWPAGSAFRICTQCVRSTWRNLATMPPNDGSAS